MQSTFLNLCFSSLKFTKFVTTVMCSTVIDYDLLLSMSLRVCVVVHVLMPALNK